MTKSKNPRIKSQPQRIVETTEEVVLEVETEEVSLEVVQEQECLEQICESVLEPVLVEPESVLEPVLPEPESVLEPVLVEPEPVLEPVLAEPEPVLEPVLAEPERPAEAVDGEAFEDVVLVTPEVTQKDIQSVRKYMDDEEEEIRVTRSAKKLFCVVQ